MINNCHVYIVNLILKIKIENKPVLGFYYSDFDSAKKFEPYRTYSLCI